MCHCVYSSTDPDGVGDALSQGSAGVPAEDLELPAVVHIPLTHPGAGQRVQAAGRRPPHYTVELQGEKSQDGGVQR